MGIPLLVEAVTFAIAVLNNIITTLREAVKLVYQVLVDLKDWLWGLITWITSTFPFNDSEKTFALSMFVFIGVVGLIFVFGGGVDGWIYSGISDVSDTVNVGVSFGGLGDGRIDGKVDGEVPGGGGDVDVNPPGSFGSCLSHEDCRVGGEDDLGDLKCCIPTFWEGFSCSGHCLADESYNDVYCQNPNACYYLGESFIEHADADDPNRCDVWVGWDEPGWASPNRFCSRKAGGSEGYDSLSRCCGSRVGEFASPCYGYCLKSGSSYSCDDITACFNEGDVVVVSIEPGEVVS